MIDLNRRNLLIGTSALAGAAALGSQAQAEVPAGRDPFDYEITRTEAEWRAMLSEEEYVILRDGGTEFPHTSPLAEETGDGTYACKGCDLLHYESVAKVILDKGWVFFIGSVANSQLTSQDAFAEMGDGSEFAIETHCRRCGSHIGHILPVEGQALHCINGAALTFTPAAA